MLKIEGKTFMNIQEAVQWLLKNNALPFQSSANYVANTEIGMGTIVNPSPAKVRIGSLIFFADSKVSTVTGLTENGFIVSDKYNDLVDDIVYVSNVALNASGHLIVTLSNGNTIDAGLIKQVSGFSINASQHLIVSFNDGTTTDLGAIFSGNITISGDLTVTGTASADKVTGNEILEIMTDAYRWDPDTPSVNYNKEDIFVGVTKTGNKITFVIFTKITNLGSIEGNIRLGQFQISSAVGSKLYPTTIGLYDYLDIKRVDAICEDLTHVNIEAYIQKYSNYTLAFGIRGQSSFVANKPYFLRLEVTFLLGANLAS